MTSQAEQIAAAMSELDEYLERLPRCSDGYCIIVKPNGMHTNGGCRCNTDKILMQRYAYAHNRLADAIRSILTAQGESK